MAPLAAAAAAGRIAGPADHVSSNERMARLELLGLSEERSLELASLPVTKETNLADLDPADLDALWRAPIWRLNSTAI